MQTYAMTIQKGGAGKTTLAYHLAHALAIAGKRVLAVDLDPQGSMSDGFIARDTLEAFTYDVFDKKASAPAPQLVRENLWLLGADKDVSAVEQSVDPDTFWVLKEYLTALAESFDYTIIDTPPSLGILPTCAMVASDGVIIPLAAEGQHIAGMKQVRETISNIQTRLNPNLTIVGHVLNNVNWSRAMSKEVQTQLAEKLQGSFFKTAIATNVRVAEAWSHLQTIFEYDPEGKGAKEMNAFTQEFIGRITDGAETQAA